MGSKAEDYPRFLRGPRGESAEGGFRKKLGEIGGWRETGTIRKARWLFWMQVSRPKAGLIRRGFTGAVREVDRLLAVKRTGNLQPLAVFAIACSTFYTS